MNKIYSILYKRIESQLKNTPVYLSMIGALCVAFGQALPANIIWSVSNPIIVLRNLKNGDKAQAQMFGLFTIIAWMGVIIAYRGLI